MVDAKIKTARRGDGSVWSAVEVIPDSDRIAQQETDAFKLHCKACKTDVQLNNPYKWWGGHKKTSAHIKHRSLLKKMKTNQVCFSKAWLFVLYTFSKSC